MSFYQNVVIEYLRADRALFVNTECCLQLNSGDNPDTSGPHWYCDATTVDLRAQIVFLCEISYSATLDALVKRLSGWHEHWDGVVAALRRDCYVPAAWPARPWLFVHEEAISVLLKRLSQIAPNLAFRPRITPLEFVQPWRYCSWNRVGEQTKPDVIPADMR